MRSSIQSAAMVGTMLMILGLGVARAQVSGNCFLAGQTDHAGTSVVFTSLSPGALTDSTSTDSIGAYSLFLQDGLYGVAFRHTGYRSQILPDPVMLASAPVTLADVTLQPGLYLEISGDIGTAHWPTGSTIRVMDAAFLAQGDTLTIDPGVRIEVATPWGMTLSGTVDFRGTDQDSITFVSMPSNGNPYFSKVIVNGCGQGTLSHCAFFGFNEIQLGGWCQNDPGQPIIMDQCLVDGIWSGVVASDGDVRITDSTFRNSVGNAIWGMNCDSTFVVERCRINAARGNLITLDNCQGSVVNDCMLVGPTGGPGAADGIFLNGSQATLSGCTISGSTSAGIRATGGGSSLISRCVVTGCTDGVVLTDNSSSLENVTLGNQAGSGVVVTNTMLPGSGPGINSCILWGNGTGITFEGSTAGTVYNDLHNNGTDAAGSLVPFAFGTPFAPNANGDMADIYLNIFLDPMFTGPGAGDFTLLPPSPCIDAGDPARLDPDGTVSDLGAFFFDQSLSSVSIPDPGRQELLCSPNPFNPVTTIHFTLEQDGRVNLAVYDPRGRRIRTLLQESLLEGPHSVTWDGRDQAGRPCPSGTYLLRLEDAGRVTTGRLLLAK